MFGISDNTIRSKFTFLTVLTIYKHYILKCNFRKKQKKRKALTEIVIYLCLSHSIKMILYYYVYYFSLNFQYDWIIFSCVIINKEFITPVKNPCYKYPCISGQKPKISLSISLKLQKAKITLLIFWGFWYHISLVENYYTSNKY